MEIMVHEDAEFEEAEVGEVVGEVEPFDGG